MSYNSNNILSCFTPKEISLMENILHDTLEENSIEGMYSDNDLNEIEYILKQKEASQNNMFFDNMDLSDCDSIKRIKGLISQDKSIHKFYPRQSRKRISLFQDQNDPSKLFNAFKPKKKRKPPFLLDVSLVKGFVRRMRRYMHIRTAIFKTMVGFIVQYWGHLLKNCEKTSIKMQYDFIVDDKLIKSLNQYGNKRYHTIPRKSTLKFIWLSHTHRMPALSSFDAKVWKIKYSSNSIQLRKKSLGKTKETRKVGKWLLGPTLGKGGYSWVKKGYDRKDGRIVALKFISKLKKDWSISQSKQISNEISALSQINHANILKLLGYNLNAKYPNKDGLITPSVLLVLEYAPGGELFDILYYTSALNEYISRTYFHQLMDGMQALHDAGICHRDIKPQNLLLDSNFQLKIVDFGLAKVFENDDDALMKTFYIGTKGYQAPEILKKKTYTVACDIFSCGVVLFILLSGYPPFEAASPKCMWYAPLTTGNTREFWKQHRGCGIPAMAKDLITRMLWYDDKKRITIKGIKRHKWYKKEILNQRQLIRELRILHSECQIKRNEDTEKQKELQYSMKRGAK